MASPLGARLRAAREHAGLPREYVAWRIGRCVASIRHYESGRTDPPATVVADLAALYDVTAGDLLDERKVPHAA